MISTLSIICMVVTLLISLVLPLGVFALYGQRQNKNAVWLAGIFGACGFLIMQMGIRLPILNSLAAKPEFMSWVENNYIVYCLVLAFTAGLFEVVARYTVAKILQKSKKLAPELTYEIGFMAGIGHGGIEAVALIGLTYINNLLFSIMINAGEWQGLLETIKAAGDNSVYEAYASVEAALIETPWYLYLAAGYERILTVIAHIAMTLIVFYFVSRKKDILGIVICVGFHTAIDFFVPLANGLASEYMGNRISQSTAYIVTYALLTFIAVAAVFIMIRLKKMWISPECKSSAEE